MKSSQPMGITANSVELNIEELVLHGFSPADRYAIVAAVEHELSQLLVAQFGEGVPSLFAQSSEHERLDAGAFNVTPGANSNSIGSQIAQTVHRGLNEIKG